MTFLPIVDRELRVAARRKGTYWSRIGAAALAVFLLAMVMAISEMGRRGGVAFGSQLGMILFSMFSWLSFAFVSAAGVFLTSDSLSEEKREGTLGLLFLTDLRGYDIVLGKLFSHSLVATYGLMAAFPVIGIAFLLGGVTGGEFWRLMLVLFNTLFFSLAVGVFISAISRDAQRAMTGAALLFGLFVAVFPMIDWSIAEWDATKFEPRFSLVSPSYALTEARSTQLANFWTCLAFVHVLAWAFLGAAAWLAPRRWQETASKEKEGSASRAQRWRFGSPKKRRTLRERWLADNPARWLAGRDLWMGRFLWMALAGFIVIGFLLSVRRADSNVLAGVSQGSAAFYSLLLNLWVATFATRFFIDAMRTGTMELLLATPLEPRQIVQGQWWAIRRTFAGPLLVLVIFQAAATWLQIEQNLAINLKNNPSLQTNQQWIQDMYAGLVVNAVCSMLTTISGLIAVAWVGMWMGLVSKKANHAVIKAVVLVQGLPPIVLGFATFALQIGSNVMGGYWAWWIPQLIMSVVGIGVDIAFILYARRRLNRDLRLVAARGADDAGGSKFRWLKFSRAKEPTAGAVS